LYKVRIFRCLDLFANLYIIRLMKRLLTLNFLILFLCCGTAPHEKALKILNAGIKDSSVVIQVNAAKGLQEIGDSRGIELLYKILRGDDTDGIVAALGALYELREERLSPLVVNLIKNSDPLVRTEAYRVIAELSQPEVKKILIDGTKDRIVRIRRIAYRGLAQFKDKTVLQPGLRDPDPIVRIESARSLGLCGEKGMENFIRNELKLKNPEVWAQGVLALAELRDTSALDFIKKLLVETPWDLKITACEALLILNDRSGIDILKQGLESEDPFVRIKTVGVLKRFLISELFEPLKEATKDEYINVSITAIEALARYRQKECKNLFAKLMDAPNPLVKIAAATAYLREE